MLELRIFRHHINSLSNIDRLNNHKAREMFLKPT